MARKVQEFVGRYSSSIEASKAANAWEYRNWAYFGKAMVEQATIEAYPKEKPGTYLVWGYRSDSCD